MDMLELSYDLPPHVLATPAGEEIAMLTQLVGRGMIQEANDDAIE